MSGLSHAAAPTFLPISLPRASMSSVTGIPGARNSDDACPEKPASGASMRTAAASNDTKRETQNRFMSRVATLS